MARRELTPEERRRREEAQAKREQNRRTLDAKYWHRDGSMIDQSEWADRLWGVIWSEALEHITPRIPSLERAGVVALVEFIGDSQLRDPARALAENIKRTADAAYIDKRTVQRWVKGAGARGELGEKAEIRGATAAGRARIWLTLRGAAREAALAQLRHDMRAEGLGGNLVSVFYISKERRAREFEAGADGETCANRVTFAMQLEAYDDAAEEWLNAAMEDYGITEGIVTIDGGKDAADAEARARIIKRAEELARMTPGQRERERQENLRHAAGIAPVSSAQHDAIDGTSCELFIGWGEPNAREPEARPYAPKSSDEPGVIE